MGAQKGGKGAARTEGKAGNAKDLAPDKDGQQDPTDAPGTAVAHVPSDPSIGRRGMVLPLIAVGGGLGGAAAGKVLIEGIGWVSRKAAMKIGPMIATGGLYEATAQGIRRIQRWWSGAPKSEEEEEIELNPSTIAAIKKWWNKTSEEKEE